jgi:hypothetical protein
MRFSFWVFWVFLMIVLVTGRIPRWVQACILLAGFACLAPYVIGCCVICLR